MAQSADVADTHAEAAASLGKNSNYAYGEADFWAGYLSERLDWSVKCTADILSLSVKNEHERKKTQDRTGRNLIRIGNGLPGKY